MSRREDLKHQDESSDITPISGSLSYPSPYFLEPDSTEAELPADHSSVLPHAISHYAMPFTNMPFPVESWKEPEFVTTHPGLLAYPNLVPVIGTISNDTLITKPSENQQIINDDRNFNSPLFMTKLTDTHENPWATQYEGFVDWIPESGNPVTSQDFVREEEEISDEEEIDEEGEKAMEEKFWICPT